MKYVSAKMVKTGHDLHEFRNQFGRGRRALELALRSYDPTMSPAPYRKNLVKYEDENLEIPEVWLAALPSIEAEWRGQQGEEAEVEVRAVGAPSSNAEGGEEEVSEETAEAVDRIRKILDYHSIGRDHDRFTLFQQVYTLAQDLDAAQAALDDIKAKTGLDGADLREVLAVVEANME